MQSLKGHLLVAGPAMPDSIFRQAVVLMLEHNPEGALGIILNKPTGMSIAQAWAQVSDIPCHSRGLIHTGGPCDGPLMVLHVHEDHAQMNVLPGLYFATDERDVQWLVEQSAAPIRFFVGYAGWSAGQLESELAQGDWTTHQATFDHVFTPPGNLWQKLMRQNKISRHADIPEKLVPKNPSDN